MNLFKLPQDILKLIFEYDGTYKEKFTKLLYGANLRDITIKKFIKNMDYNDLKYSMNYIFSNFSNISVYKRDDIKMIVNNEFDFKILIEEDFYTHEFIVNSNIQIEDYDDEYMSAGGYD